MLDTTPHQTEDKLLQKNILIERLQLYYQSLNQSILAIVINSSILLGFLWGDIEKSSLIGWYGCILITVFYRVFTLRQFSRVDKSHHIKRKWYLHMLIGSMLSGLSWGIAGYFLFSDNIFYQSLLAFIIAGMCAGGIINLSSFLESSLSFLWLTLTPFFIRLIQDGSTEALQMSFMVFLYAALLSVSARRVHNTVIAGLKMKFMYQKAQDKIQRHAFYDELTALPNRRLLRDRTHQALAQSKRSALKGALLFLDLDNFKRINDTLGHTFGDGLLKQVAKRLSTQLRVNDTAARLGGDEFVVLLTDFKGNAYNVGNSVMIIAEKIRHSLAVPFNVEGHELYVTSSIGIALFPDDGDNVDNLLKHADAAMYLAKDNGKNAIQFYLKGMQDSLNKRLELEKSLHSALQNEEFQLFFQPLVNSKGVIFGGEALIRWVKSNGDIVTPDDFIPIAEETGLIFLIGGWVLKETCRCLKEMVADHTNSGFKYLSMNVSPKEFRQHDFVQKIEAELALHQLSGEHLEIEVTENLLLDDIEGTIEKMNQLRRLGIRFSIDDFGTGYSSLAYLKKLPVNVLKIDRSFIKDILTDKNDASIVKTILTMANMLELKVIAEGVDSEEIWFFLNQHGSPCLQGYLFGKPMPFNSFKEIF